MKLWILSIRADIPRLVRIFPAIKKSILRGEVNYLNRFYCFFTRRFYNEIFLCFREISNLGYNKGRIRFLRYGFSDKGATVNGRIIIIISAHNPIRFNKLYSMIGITGEMKILRSLCHNYTAISLIGCNTFLYNFKSSVGRAIVRKDVFEFSLVVLSKGAFYGTTNVLLTVVRKQYIR